MITNREISKVTGDNGKSRCIVSITGVKNEIRFLFLSDSEFVQMDTFYPMYNVKKQKEETFSQRFFLSKEDIKEIAKLIE
jgi:hypothetical protein